jgi:CPA2 family monovalent cation:H+ antiporter-2
MDDTARAVLEIGLILVLATLAAALARSAGLPAVLGYLVVGLLVSPFTPGYVADRQQLQLLADVGVVLLLFEVGIEIDPLRLRHEQGRLLWLAPLQTVVSAALAGGVTIATGVGVRGAMVIGLSVALSSSVVVVNITRSRRRTANRATAEALLGWSVLQDMTGVAFAIGILASLRKDSPPLPLIVAGIALFIAIASAAAWLLPRLLRKLTSQHDLFLMLSVGSGLVVAGLGARFFDIPLALAAFVAGLAISEGPATAEARRRLLPFRDLFAVFFFVAVGSLIDPAAVPGALPWLCLVLGLVMAAKLAPIYLLARLSHLPGVRSWQLAVGLGQIGEFSFVLASVGLAEHVIPSAAYTAILAGVVITIALTTVIVRLGKPSAALEPAAT